MREPSDLMVASMGTSPEECSTLGRFHKKAEKPRKYLEDSSEHLPLQDAQLQPHLEEQLEENLEERRLREAMRRKTRGSRHVVRPSPVAVPWRSVVSSRTLQKANPSPLAVRRFQSPGGAHGLLRNLTGKSVLRVRLAEELLICTSRPTVGSDGRPPTVGLAAPAPAAGGCPAKHLMAVP